MGVLVRAVGRYYGNKQFKKTMKKEKPEGRLEKRIHTRMQNLGADIAQHKAQKVHPILGWFKKGGIVKKTGAYILHKGEKVIPARRKT